MIFSGVVLYPQGSSKGLSLRSHYPLLNILSKLRKTSLPNPFRPFYVKHLRTYPCKRREPYFMKRQWGVIWKPLRLWTTYSTFRPFTSRRKRNSAAHVNLSIRRIVGICRGHVQPKITSLQTSDMTIQQNSNLPSHAVCQESILSSQSSYDAPLAELPPTSIRFCLDHFQGLPHCR
jgi:hypothetical protein